MTNRSFCVLSRLLPASLLVLSPLVAQAHLVADMNPGGAASGISTLLSFGDRCWFHYTDATGSKLWSSDGTAAGTTAEVVLDGAGTAPFNYPTDLAVVGGRIVMAFGGDGTGTPTGLELWASDGTQAGTAMLMDIRPGSFGSNPRDFGVIDGVAYFSAASAGANYELWRTDGTTAGTWLVKEIHTSTSTGSNPAYYAKLGTTGRFLFAATDSTAGRELWVSDGTAAGTLLVKDIVPGPGGVASSNPIGMISFGDLVVFRALNEVWTSDGTTAGTVALTSSLVYPHQFAVQGGKLFFQGNDAAHGSELWVSDGTTVGTYFLHDLLLGTSSSMPLTLTPIGSRWVFFSATTAFGSELWRTDGVTTELYQDINVGAASSSPTGNATLANPRFTVTPGGKMFFLANNGTAGSEPFVYDTGVLAAAATYGSSCSSLSLTSTIPHLGSTVLMTTSFVPAAAVGSIHFLSTTKYAPPIDLGLVGMPGCLLHCGLDVGTLALGSGSFTVPFAIPSAATWLGFELHAQSFSFVPGANPFGAVASNGLTMTLGDL